MLRCGCKNKDKNAENKASDGNRQKDMYIYIFDEI